jgi:EpsI family protein
MLSRYRLRAPILALNFLLVVQAAGFYVFSRKEAAPAAISLNDLPQQIGDWRGIEDITLDPESMGILRPDDYIIRNYQSGSEAILANLFVAYFRSQHTDRTPHSPQNCLPGNGWTWTTKKTITLTVPDSPARPIHVNLMLVTRGDDKSIVVYWYHTPTRVIANEYMARAQLMLDSIRHNRSDTALVRIVVPVAAENSERAEQLAIQFAQAVQPTIRQYIPMLL